MAENCEEKSGESVELSDTDSWMFGNLIRGLFERQLKPLRKLLVFVREKPYNLWYNVIDDGVYRVYICEYPDNCLALMAFDFDAGSERVQNFLPDSNTVKGFLESFIVAGHW
ncbi:hypothetical protein A3I58_00390 [Candidatus Peregrinibacteria bacterium RIFCSPLOWO2_02_FULL_39_10]|nr:MAG: hypothetical protein A3I58_00390 [Candidatus Peregrinibacteria bacterium RIFCSPLOWO2_02_FULL_39_10]